MKRYISIIAFALFAASSFAASAEVAPTSTRYQTVQVDDVEVFYREAGALTSPTLLLLHGFPSSSHQYRELITELADDYRVIAPDYPGFGNTVAPPRGEYEFTFENLADTMDQFTQALELDRFAMYVFDYGAPIGFRIAIENPEKVTAIITQNGNAYEAGLSDGFAKVQEYWKNDTQENRDALRPFLSVETTTWQYYFGAPESRKHLVSPDSIAHDQAILDRDPEIQLDLLKSYKSNVDSYPIWQEYLRENQPPVLAVWAKNDPFFIPPGAEAFKKDVPNAQIEYVNAGHFALETHLPEIANHIRTFLGSL